MMSTVMNGRAAKHHQRPNIIFIIVRRMCLVVGVIFVSAIIVQQQNHVSGMERGVLKPGSHRAEANVKELNIKENIALAFAFILCEYTSHYHTLSWCDGWNDQGRGYHPLVHTLKIIPIIFPGHFSGTSNWYPCFELLVIWAVWNGFLSGATPADLLVTSITNHFTHW